MPRCIQLCYRKIISSESVAHWDRLVWDSSFQEYALQVQFYEKEHRFTFFSELINQVPAAAKLHFLVSAAITGYIPQLNGLIPDIRNTLGKLLLPFQQYRFELIESARSDKKYHRVAISFYSNPLTWHDTVADQLLLSVASPDHLSKSWHTDMIKLQPFLSIHSLSETHDQLANAR